MKSFSGFLLALTFTVATSVASSQVCTKIKDGGLTDVKGNQIKLGYDHYAYNYQAHMFNGLYENYTRPAVVRGQGEFDDEVVR